MANISKAHVSIRFFGDDLEPEELTRVLGAKPSRGRRKGESRTMPNGETRVARRGSWIIHYAEAPSPVEIDEQLSILLNKLTDNTVIWRDLTSRYDADVFCGLFLDAWNEGFCLAASTLERLSDRGLPIGFDMYAPTDTWYGGQEDPAQHG